MRYNLKTILEALNKYNEHDINATITRVYEELEGFEKELREKYMAACNADDYFLIELYLEILGE